MPLSAVRSRRSFRRQLLFRNAGVPPALLTLGAQRKNEGKNLPILKLPEPTVLLHNNVAVAYGTSQSTGPDGKIKETRYADYYVWENGKWHAFFAQQTSVEK